MERIDGHIIDKSLLTKGGLILDAGCRGFTLHGSLGDDYEYICFDPDDTITRPDKLNINLHYLAITAHGGPAKYCGWSTGEGNIIYTGNAPNYAEFDKVVASITIPVLFAMYGKFDLIKLDIEGSEYDVLLGIDFAPAKQISCEFHQSLGYNKYGSHQDYILLLMSTEFGKHYYIADCYEYPNLPGMYEYLFIAK